MIRLKVVVILLVLSLSKYYNANLQAQNHFKTAYEELIKDPCFKNSVIGCSIRNLKTGEVVFKENGQIPLAAASTQKVVTTATGLALLGPNYQFETKLYYSGEIDSLGILHGDLIIEGGGDPTLGSNKFKHSYSDTSLLNTLKKNKIRAIDGKVLVDASRYEQNPISDYAQWIDMGNYYGTGTWALNYNENLYYLDLKPGILGDSVRVVGTRPSQELRFINNIKTAAKGTGDQAFIYGSPIDNIRLLQGTVPAVSLFSIKGSIANVPLFFAKYIYNFLNDNNIKVTNFSSTHEKIRTQKKLLKIYYSPTLKEIVKQTNLKSINICADAILKEIGYKQTGNGSFNSGILATYRYLESIGLDKTKINMVDGSGLSSANYIQADFLSQFLAKIKKMNYYESFIQSLPEAGSTGTLANLCIGTKAQNNLKAKSGNINKVTAYAGYVRTSSKTELSFAIIAAYCQCDNGYVIKKLEPFLSKLAD